MVLERIISPKTAKEHVSIVLLAGGIIASISVLIAYFVFVNTTFENAIGIFVTFFITIGIFPFMINIGSYDEAKDESMQKFEKGENIFSRHSTIIKVYVAFFLGVIMSLSILYMILPSDISTKIFHDQINEISRIRGDATTLTGTFSSILRNNFQVLVLSFLFSFVFGAGAIYILAWNSSVLASAIGESAKVLGVPDAVLQYFPHGSLEFLAYFIGAIAGGIISFALTRRKHKHFWFIVEDSLKMLIIAVIILAVAAFIESFCIVYCK